MKKAFVAYPDSPADIGLAIEAASKAGHPTVRILTWKRPDAAGEGLHGQVTDAIRDADVVAADITTLNFNVVYELGYAIGLGRRVIPLRHAALVAPDDDVARIGIFDTLIYKTYANSADIVSALAAADPGRRFATNFPFDPSPLYVVLPEVKTEDILSLSAKPRRAGLRARTYDAAEESRLAATDAIRAVASSYGVVLPLLPPNHKEHLTHNTRVAFVAGLAHGMDKPALLIKRGNWAVALDVRDFVERHDNEQQLAKLFEDFAQRVYADYMTTPPPRPDKKNPLAELAMGDPAAENEEASLNEYFLERDEFRQAINGPAHIVAGRKGSGKTAMFMMIRDKLKEDRSQIVVDLNPETYQLRKLKDLVLQCLSAGTKEHLLSAFWEYVILLEICSKILDKDKDVHKRDHRLFDPYQRLLKFYREETASTGTHFSERLSKLIERITTTYQSKFKDKKDVVLAEGQVTNILYETSLPALRSEIEAYALFKGSTFVLFDNLDKGWNANGLEDADVVMIRTLLDAARKLENDFRAHERTLRCIIFLRNDIHELLVAKTADRGKETAISVDWDQPELLKHMLQKRFVASHAEKKVKIEQVWRGICAAPMVDGEESLEFLISRSLMRPRFLLRLFNHCKSNAVNFGRDRIDEEDIRKGFGSYSTYMTREVGHEIGDVLGTGNDLLYLFLGRTKEITKGEVMKLLQSKFPDVAKANAGLALLLWHGVCGLKRSPSRVDFVYDVNYDLMRLLAAIDKQGDHAVLMINPAFWPGLEIQE